MIPIFDQLTSQNAKNNLIPILPKFGSKLKLIITRLITMRSKPDYVEADLL